MTTKKFNAYNFICMSVQFKMIPKKKSMVSPPKVKCYPCAVSKSELNLNNLAKIISSRLTFSRPDCYGVIMALSEVIGEALSDGKIVRIESLGTFQLNLSGTPAATANAIGKSNIKGAKISYKPSKDLKSKVNKITYKRMR